LINKDYSEFFIFFFLWTSKKMYVRFRRIVETFRSGCIVGMITSLASFSPNDVIFRKLISDQQLRTGRQKIKEKSMNSLTVKCPACSAANRLPAGKQHLGPKCGRCGKKLDLSRAAVPVELNDADFQNFIANASLPILVDFFSPTCGPCRMVAPIIDSLTRRYLNRMIVAKLDTSRHPQTPSRFRIRGVPTLLFFKNGHPVDQLVGAADEATLARKMDFILSTP
jgi:thioredoxin